MPKNRKGHNKRGFHKGRDLRYADLKNGEKYALVKKALGSGPRGPMFQTELIRDNTIYNVSLAGSLSKCRIKTGDLVLLEPLTDTDYGKHRIIFSYTVKQYKILKKEGYLNILKEEVEDENDDLWMFEGEDDKNNDVDEIDDSFIADI